MRKLITYSLWGKNPKYTIGAIKNAEKNVIIYPDYISRFYVDLTVPKDIIFELEDMKNVEVVQKNVIGDWRFSLNRFLPLSEHGVERFLSRDCDSRCSDREKNAVKEWENSGKVFHIMRDHPFHGGFPILAGMFGSKGNIIPDVSDMIDNENLSDTYHSDQTFLSKYIYPLIKDNCLVHDEFFEKKPFPDKRTNKEYVGIPLDENDHICFPEHLNYI